jgi:hypothetical protein
VLKNEISRLKLATVEFREYWKPSLNHDQSEKISKELREVGLKQKQQEQDSRYSTLKTPTRINQTIAKYEYQENNVKITLRGDYLDITKCEFEDYPETTNFHIDLSNIKHFRTEDVQLLLSIKRCLSDRIKISASENSRVFAKLKQMKLTNLLLN